MGVARESQSGNSSARPSPGLRRVRTAEAGISERRARAALGLYRSTQRRTPQTSDDEVAPLADTVELARTYGRHGYRRIPEMLQTVGRDVNVRRVARIWRRERLKIPVAFGSMTAGACGYAPKGAILGGPTVLSRNGR